MPVQSKRNVAHLERVLVIVGGQHAGKSTHLRSMYVDPRFGSDGVIPTQKQLSLVSLSRERCLKIRLSSPHETNEKLKDFIKKLDRSLQRAWRKGFWRVNYAFPSQPHATRRTPDVVTICREIHRQYWITS